MIDKMGLFRYSIYQYIETERWDLVHGRMATVIQVK